MTSGWEKLPRLGDEQGAAALEFALITPVLLMTLVGLYDLGHSLYAESVMEGAVQEVSRASSIEAADTVTLDSIVTRTIHRVLPNATLTFDRKSYDNFTDVARPEEYIDVDGDETCSIGEPFEDANGNGTWDSDRGRSGVGSSRMAVLYTVTATYDRLFPVPEFLGFPQETSISARTVLRNQPYQRMAYTPPATLNCE